MFSAFLKVQGPQLAQLGPSLLSSFVEAFVGGFVLGLGV